MDEPTAEDIYWIFVEHPNTTFLTVSRASAAWVNEAAVKGKFEGQRILAVVPGDPEANPDNFRGSTQEWREPMRTPICAGMK
eukprot:13585358-Alexandrium_andersonii.AAC.1